MEIDVYWPFVIHHFTSIGGKLILRKIVSWVFTPLRVRAFRSMLAHRRMR
jgi:hypothetical protein